MFKNPIYNISKYFKKKAELKRTHKPNKDKKCVIFENNKKVVKKI